MDKNAVELNIASRNITGLAINAQGLNVQEYDGKIYRYDMKTGSSSYYYRGSSLIYDES